MRTKREKETGHCRICCGNRRSDVPSKTLTLDFIRIRCVGANTIKMILHQIWFPLFTEQVCNESEVLRKFWSQSQGASYQLFRSSLSAHFHLGKRFIRICRGIWNSNLCLLISDLGQPLPSPMKWTCMKSNMRKRPTAEDVVDHDDDDDDNASSIAFPHFPSPKHNNRKTRKYQHLENSCNMKILKMWMLLKVMMI